jgi:hypothetical protein
MDRRWMYGFLAVSFLVYAIPTSRLRHVQLSSKPAVYRKLGVRWANRLAQNGSLINGILRRRYPDLGSRRTRSTMKNLIATTYQAERFHLALLFFFLFSSLYAVAVGAVAWAALILATNIIYNLYPIWLQQYVRARIKLSRPA